MKSQLIGLKTVGESKQIPNSQQTPFKWHIDFKVLWCYHRHLSFNSLIDVHWLLHPSMSTLVTGLKSIPTYMHTHILVHKHTHTGKDPIYETEIIHLSNISDAIHVSISGWQKWHWTLGQKAISCVELVMKNRAEHLSFRNRDYL